MKIYQVGGAVRDKLLGLQPHDKDYVVVGSTPDEMKALGFIEVGKGFPVYLHPQTKEEYALARKEIKTGPKHTDFTFVFNEKVTLEEDLARRDFTCNAIAYDILTGSLIDCFNGQDDIKNKVLRHICTEHFAEDPLRVLRLCRFAAQLNFTPAPETLRLCAQMVESGMLKFLTPERVWNEFLKAMSCSHFYRFIEVARQIGALRVIAPEIEAIWEYSEKNIGDVVSTALKYVAEESPLVKFGVLLHHIGGICTSENKMSVEAKIKDVCNRLKISGKFRDFALLTATDDIHLCKFSEQDFEKLYGLAESMTKGHICYVEDFVAVCKAYFSAETQNAECRSSDDFTQKVNLLRFICTLSEQIKAEDMPFFNDLPKDKTFGSKLREYKIGIIRESLSKRSC